MATREDLWEISKVRLKSAEILMAGSDWTGAAYMLGYVLECALKACVCKTLELYEYPTDSSSKEVKSFFLTHSFDQLQIISGLSSLFSATGGAAWKNWSEFTKEFPGKDWVAMRYDQGILVKFDETLVRKLHSNLVDPQDGVLGAIEDRMNR